MTASLTMGYSYINNWTETTAIARRVTGDVVNTVAIEDIYDTGLGETLTGTESELIDCVMVHLLPGI